MIVIGNSIIGLGSEFPITIMMIASDEKLRTEVFFLSHFSPFSLNIIFLYGNLSDLEMIY